MFARKAWYMAGWSHELERRPLARTLLGETLALYRDAEGVAHALDARCPHRGADLGKGRVVGGALECPFHGWRFGADGRCIAIPSQPADLRIAAEARVRSYRLHEQQGILWIWPGDMERTLPQPPWHSFWEPGPRRRRSFASQRLIEAPFVSVVENAIDNSHLAFVHRNSLPGHPKLISRQRIVVDENRAGFRGEDDPESPWAPRGEPSLARSWSRLLLKLAGFRAASEYYYRFELPGLVFHHTSYADGTWDVVLANSTPADARRTWFFAEVVRTRAPHLIGDLAQRVFEQAVAREDERALGALLAREPSGREQPLSVAADEAGLAFRRLYAALAQAEGRRVPWEQEASRPPLRVVDGS